jgi:hypothetical protein
LSVAHAAEANGRHGRAAKTARMGRRAKRMNDDKVCHRMPVSQLRRMLNIV